MEYLKSLSKNERRLLQACLLGMLLCLSLFLSEDLMRFLVMKEEPNRIPIGIIANQKSDTRIRSQSQFVWFETRQDQSLKMGDSVFTGENSSLQIRLLRGSQIDLGENSLMNFEKNEGEDLARLAGGNFKLKINGKLKISIDGKLTSFDGHGAEVAVNFDSKGVPRIQLLKGSATVTQSGITRKLLLVNSEDKKPSPEKVVAENKNSVEKLFAVEKIHYIWKLYDLYEINEQELIEKSDPIFDQDMLLTLNWDAQNTQVGKVQVSSKSDFLLSSSAEIKSGTPEFFRLSLGLNYWRVSVDKEQTWSRPEVIQVDAGLLSNAAPHLREPIIRLPMRGKMISIRVPISNGIDVLGYVAEASLDERFDKKYTKAFWSEGEQISLSFFHPGRYYYRFRSVAKNQELSAWSSVQKFEIYQTHTPKAPTLARISGHEIYVGDSVDLAWSSQEAIVVTEIVSEGKIVSQLLNSKTVRQNFSAPGEYFIRGYAKNEFGDQSKASEIEKIVVRDRPRLTREQPKQRKPAAENQTSMKLEQVKIEKPLNENYKDRQLSMQGLLWTIQSSQQDFAGDQSPVATGLGLHLMMWQNSHGIEASFKSAILGLNDAGTVQSLKDLEARYHYRVLMHLPFSFLRETQISLFSGVEFYRNSGGASFSSEYDLVKFGTSLQFPLWSKWSTGGEFVYGHGFDSSTKSEISGHITYYLEPKWSLGAGYRIHLFEAGSKKSAAGGYLPFREGYTEGYSILNYHF